MSKLLPIGTVVKLKEDEQLLMIISRVPLFNQNSTIGYFDYSSVLYPQGQVSENSYFFNELDIEKVIFKGYVSQAEEDLQKMLLDKMGDITYPKFEKH